eukprot:Skav211144  [mRNA]  locus=scaffold4091:295420:297840:+ [translate_table: standard]
MALLTTLVFLALARCKTLNLGNEGRCRCKEKHTKEFIEEKELIYKSEVDGEMKDYSDFGIGCRIHTRDPEFIGRIYKHDAAEQLLCDDEARDPWCNSKWCYIDPDKSCSLDFQHGRLGKFSHATCGNLQQAWAKYAVESLAARLKGDPLRVLHLENTLDDGYMGNSNCSSIDSSAASRDSHVSDVDCRDSLMATFWRESLESLENARVLVEPKLIQNNSDSIDAFFNSNNITESFYNYSEEGTNATNFDLCAFATGLGLVDLCSGTVALTHERQEMTYLIELYTTSAFFVSESTCVVDQPFWWIHVFSREAWIFFAGVVFIFTVLMYAFDEFFVSECNSQMPTGWTCRDCWKKCVFAAGLLFTCVLGIVVACIEQRPKVINHAREGTNAGEERKSRGSWCVSAGLKLFIFVTATLYASSLTSELIAGKQNGKYPSLEDAAKNTTGVTVCFHQVYQTLMKRDGESSHINHLPFKNWEKLREGLEEQSKCHAAIMEEDAWNTFRSRGKLCGFYKPPTPTFYMPTGAPVSRRAYRTLETFRFNKTSKVANFERGRNEKLKEEKWKDKCPKTDCEKAPWQAFGTIAGAACMFCVCGSCVKVYQKCYPEAAPANQEDLPPGAAGGTAPAAGPEPDIHNPAGAAGGATPAAGPEPAVGREPDIETPAAAEGAAPAAGPEPDIENPAGAAGGAPPAAGPEPAVGRDPDIETPAAAEGAAPAAGPEPGIENLAEGPRRPWYVAVLQYWPSCRTDRTDATDGNQLEVGNLELGAAQSQPRHRHDIGNKAIEYTSSGSFETTTTGGVTAVAALGQA